MEGVLNILYRDDALVAIDKPSGLLVHRTALARDHVVALQLLRDQLGCLVYPVHRLDRATSGVLLFALNPETARALCAGLANRDVRKTYLAVVRGIPDVEGVVDYPLREDGKGPRQEALTAYRRLAAIELPIPVGPHGSARYALVQAEPHTGRNHQVRQHMKHISHPVVGDTQHGDGRHNRLFREYFDTQRLLLHAARLELLHPTTRRKLLIEAPLPRAMETLLTLFGWR